MIPGKGARTDLKKIIDDYKNKGIKALALDHPDLYCRYRQGLKDIFNYMRDAMPKNIPRVIWLCGPTGCGKTRQAVEMADNPEDLWMSGKNLEFFDGYEG